MSHRVGFNRRSHFPLDFETTWAGPQHHLGKGSKSGNCAKDSPYWLDCRLATLGGPGRHLRHVHLQVAANALDAVIGCTI